MQLIPDPAERLERDHSRFIVRGDRHGETVDHNVLSGNAVPVRRLINPFCDPDPSFRVRRDPVLIEDQRHQHAAVLADQREYRLDALFFAVDGVDHGLSVVDAHSSLERVRIGGIDLQGQGENTLELLHHVRHHGGLVNLGEADVHVEDVRAAVLLAQALAKNVLDIAVAQRLFEFLLPGRIDALADDHGPGADLHALREGADHCPVLARLRLKRELSDALCRKADVLRGRAAASSDRLNAHFRDLFHPAGEFLGSHVIDGPAAFRAGQARIGIDDDRHAADLGKPLHDRNHLLRPEAAVDAQRVHPQTFQKRHGGIHAAPGQKLPLLVKSNRNADRQVAVLFGRQYGRLGLIAVRHGLNQDQIRSCPAAVAHDFSEQFHRLLKGQISQGLEKLSRGPYIQRHIGVFPAGPAPGFFGVLYRGRHDLLQIIGKFERIGAKCIRVENIAPCTQISAVQVDDILGSFEIPGLRQFSALESFGLKDRSGSSVKNKPFFSKAFAQIFFHFFCSFLNHFHRDFSSKCVPRR